MSQQNNDSKKKENADRLEKMLTWKDPRGWRIGPDTGVVLEPWKVIRPAGDPKGTKWLESVGVKVVEVECATLVGPMNTGSIHCLTGSIIRDPEC